MEHSHPSKPTSTPGTGPSESGGEDPNRKATPAASIDLALLAKLSGGRRPPEEGAEGPPPSTRITITNELELEAARLRSLELTTVPPAPAAPTALSWPPDQSGSASTAPPSASEDGVIEQVGIAEVGPEEMGWEPHPLLEMRERVASGDYVAALQMADALLLEDPSSANAAEVRETAARCRELLVQGYAARLGRLDRVPTVIVPRSELPWLSLDHRAGFVLSHIDGVSSLEMIVDVSGMPPVDALRVLCELVDKRIVSLG